MSANSYNNGGNPADNTNSNSHSSESNRPLSSTATTSGKPPHNDVSECLFEFLLSEILHWVEDESESRKKAKDAAAAAANKENKNKSKKSFESESQKQPSNSSSNKSHGNSHSNSKDNKNNGTSASEQAILSAERAAAKIERLGFGVGYRLCERLAQFKPLATTHMQANPSLAANSSLASSEAGGGGPGSTMGNTNSSVVGATTNNAASHHLEAVKFLCKEFWTEVFRKQVDKLQTNHRGIFVLKDHELRWLKRFPSDDERARVAAIKMLAFPCGLIRGALSNLGIAAVVSCDFLADGKTMSSCSFNIKIKT